MPNYTELEYKAREKSNELQDTANELQQEMIDEVEKNNRVTSTHNKVMMCLSLAIVFLAGITLWTNYNKTGRYVISGGKGGVYILDTKTSRLWQRAPSANAYLGTNENPMFERISRQVKVKTFEEIDIKSETSKNNK